MRAAFLIDGQVMHERLRPVRNRFVYPVFCVRFNIDRIGELANACFGVNRWRPLAIRTRDYADGQALSPWIRKILMEANLPSDGEIWLQTFPRVFGFAFNPVNFWYCHDANGALRALMADVNNTFGETHRYLLTASDLGPIGKDTALSCQKLMHVSPFCRVEGGYQFRVRDTTNTAFTAIDYVDLEGLLIRTAVGGHIVDFSSQQLLRLLIRQPFLTLGVVVRIHLQALKLWFRGVPFHTKPAPPAQTLSLARHKGIEP